jgi:hypothetical protein
LHVIEVAEKTALWQLTLENLIDPEVGRDVPVIVTL